LKEIVEGADCLSSIDSLIHESTAQAVPLQRRHEFKQIKRPAQSDRDASSQINSNASISGEERESAGNTPTPIISTEEVKRKKRVSPASSRVKDLLGSNPHFMKAADFLSSTEKTFTRDYKWLKSKK
jgi:hypothetical protein